MDQGNGLRPGVLRFDVFHLPSQALQFVGEGHHASALVNQFLPMKRILPEEQPFFHNPCSPSRIPLFNRRQHQLVGKKKKILAGRARGHWFRTPVPCRCLNDFKALSPICTGTIAAPASNARYRNLLAKPWSTGEGSCGDPLGLIPGRHRSLPQVPPCLNSRAHLRFFGRWPRGFPR